MKMFWRKKSKLFMVSTAILTLLGDSVLAHTFYLLPDAFVVEPGATVKLTRYVDDAFPSEPQDWWPDHIKRFQIIGQNGITDGSSIRPLGIPKSARIRLQDRGNYLLAYESNSYSIKLEPDKFNQYLKQEGLDHILKLRAQKGLNNSEGREKYTRYTKVFLQVGPLQNDLYKKIVGHKIEIMPQMNPYRLKVGDKLPVKLQFEGRPLAGALVSATSEGFQGKSEYPQRVRTDQDGLASVTLTASGPWLIRTVHMLPCADVKEADWESYWGSITFEVRSTKK